MPLDRLTKYHLSNPNHAAPSCIRGILPYWLESLPVGKVGEVIEAIPQLFVELLDIWLQVKVIHKLLMQQSEFNLNVCSILHINLIEKIFGQFVRQSLVIFVVQCRINLVFL
jgi:hypothetical protein